MIQTIGTPPFHPPFRALTPRDNIAAAAIHRCALPPSVAWSAASFEQTLGSDGVFSWGVTEEKNHEVVGFILLKTILDEGEILTIAVHPHYHQQGYGQFLLEQAILWASHRFVAKLYLEVARTNIIAQKLYKKMGFRLISIRKKYYQVSKKETEDAFVFSLDL